jgi:hypothetical protein
VVGLLLSLDSLLLKKSQKKNVRFKISYLISHQSTLHTYSLAGTLLLAKSLSIVSLIPLTERSGIDLNDGALDEGVGADQLVVRSVVDDGQNTSLAGAVLRTPREVTSVETKGTVLLVTTADTNFVNTLRSKLSVSGLATQFEPECKVRSDILLNMKWFTKGAIW